MISHLLKKTASQVIRCYGCTGKIMLITETTGSLSIGLASCSRVRKKDTERCLGYIRRLLIIVLEVSEHHPRFIEKRVQITVYGTKHETFQRNIQRFAFGYFAMNNLIQNLNVSTSMNYVIIFPMRT